MKIVNGRITLLGLLSWAVPLAASFLFFDRTGQLTISQPLFKSIMVVVSGGFGAALLVLAFRRVLPSWRTGLALGCYWLFLNLALDLLVLVPLTGMTIKTYFYDIGLRYLLIPIVSTAMGAAAAEASSK
jgi:hypothetical protein